MLIAEQYAPGDYVSVQSGTPTDTQEAKQLKKRQGWIEHRTAMMKVGIPPEERPARKEMKTKWQDPSKEFDQKKEQEKE